MPAPIRNTRRSKFCNLKVSGEWVGEGHWTNRAGVLGVTKKHKTHKTAEQYTALPASVKKGTSSGDTPFATNRLAFCTDRSDKLSRKEGQLPKSN